MPEAFNLGPLLVPTQPLTVVAILLAAIWLSGRLAHKTGLDPIWMRGVAEWSAWIGVAGARAGFAVTYWPAYAEQPWSVLYFWQPGYLPLAGAALGGAYAAWRLLGRPRVERLAYLRALAAAFSLAGVLLSAAHLSAGRFTSSETLQRGDRVPDFALVDLDGATRRLYETGPVGVVLNFWATWCPPCRREMPILDAARRRFVPHGIEVIGIDLEEPTERVRDYVRSIGVEYPIWIDPPGGTQGVHTSSRALYEKFGGIGLPTTYFLGRDRTIRAVHVGELSAGYLAEQIEALIQR